MTNISTKLTANQFASSTHSNDDWLATDPLGFDEMAEDYLIMSEQSEESQYNNADPVVNTMNNLNQADVNASGAQSSQTYNNHTQNNLTQNNHTQNPMPDNLPNNMTSTEATMTDTNFDNTTHPQSIEEVQHHNIEPDIEFDGDTSRANPYFKPLLPKPIHRGESGRQLIMDTETTGLDALKGDRIIEVGIIELVDRKFTGERLHVYINPQRGMDEEVIRVHGISEAFLADKPTFDEVAQPLYDFMYGAEVIAHNAPFDISFLSMEFDKVGLKDFADTIKVTDSLVMAKQQYPGQKNTLDALVRRLNVGKMDRTFHGALLDSEILAEVYLAMTGGQVALAIDEDGESEGSSSHTDFNELAAQILKAPSHVREHVAWVAGQIKSYPALRDIQNIGFFHQLNNTNKSQHLFKIAPTPYTQNMPNLENNVFIDS